MPLHELTWEEFKEQREKFRQLSPPMEVTTMGMREEGLKDELKAEINRKGRELEADTYVIGYVYTDSKHIGWPKIQFTVGAPVMYYKRIKL